MDSKGIFIVPAFGRKIWTGPDFLNWARKFTAFAVAKGFDAALEPGGMTRMPAEYENADSMPESTEDEKVKKKAMKVNNLAIMAYLNMAMESGTAAGCLAKACDDDYPNGLAYEAWEILQKK